MQVIARSDLDFLLNDWLEVAKLTRHERFATQDPDEWRAFLDLSESIALREFLPCYKAADQDEPRLEDGRVRVEPKLRQALHVWLDAGLQLAGVAPEHGGMGLPFVIATAGMAELMAANVAGSAFFMLSIANARVLATFGSPAQIEAFAIPQFEGRALGTMCLSEPDAGSSLGDITTRAVPDGQDALGQRYKLAGNKMWISAGDQDVTDDIVHLVLAKVPQPDGTLPAGSAGISLFIVPKRLPQALGGGHNDISVQGLNHKMGYRGTPNCLLGFGENGGATGWLLGEEGQGLRIMFQMMNEARINVGLSAAAMACRGHLLSCDYAMERRQGRPLAERKAAQPVAIVNHPDIRRMLLAQRVIAEGALALCLKSAHLADMAETAPDAQTRNEAAELLGLLTPITKSWPSEEAETALSYAIQIHGGYGYTRDFDVEQLWRDNRLNPIHEGTTGIQGIDLLGRKILYDNGRTLHSFLTRLRHDASQGEGFIAEARSLIDTADHIAALVDRLLQQEDKAMALGNATGFLQAFGHLVLGWIWLDLARCAARGGDTWLARSKATSCRYFFAAELPKVPAMLALLEQAPGLTSAADTDLFDRNLM